MKVNALYKEREREKDTRKGEDGEVRRNKKCDKRQKCGFFVL